jgi:hypothetical protein
MFKSFFQNVKRALCIPKYTDYKVVAGSEEERTAITTIVESKNLACDYDKIAFQDPCKFYMLNGEITCSTCGKVQKV